MAALKLAYQEEDLNVSDTTLGPIWPKFIFLNLGLNPLINLISPFLNPYWTFSRFFEFQIQI